MAILALLAILAMAFTSLLLYLNVNRYITE
jgi:hypothetical protein